MNDKNLEMSFLAQPNHVNYHGSVHGGSVMKWIDEAGYALAVRYAQNNCVTKMVNGIEFLAPIHIGDLIYIQAKVVHQGTTSLRIEVDVASENLIEKKRKKNCTCELAFVAIDAEGNKTTIK